MRFNMLWNNSGLINLQFSSSNPENKESVWKEQKWTHFRDKGFLLHLNIMFQIIEKYMWVNKEFVFGIVKRFKPATLLKKNSDKGIC